MFTRTPRALATILRAVDADVLGLSPTGRSGSVEATHHYTGLTQDMCTIPPNFIATAFDCGLASDIDLTLNIINSIDNALLARNINISIT